MERTEQIMDDQEKLTQRQKVGSINNKMTEEIDKIKTSEIQPMPYE